jgi:hypothetical protein
MPCFVILVSSVCGQLTRKSCSSGRETLRHLRNPKVNCNVHNSPLPTLILSQMNPLYTFRPYFLNIHFNIILPSMTRSSKWSISFRSSDRISRSIYEVYETCTNYQRLYQSSVTNSLNGIMHLQSSAEVSKIK